MTSAVSLRALRYCWPGNPEPTLLIDELEIARGERVFLKGASGSGKSTLLQLLAGVLPSGAGQVSVLDQPLAALSQPARDQFRANHLGFVFQMFNLLPYLSTIDNVLLPLAFSQVRSQRVANRAGSATDQARQLLNALGLNTSVQDRSVNQLSVGQQQRVALARALIGAPELLICDEPTSAIDTPQRDRFMELLFEQLDQTGASLLFVSHDPGLQKHFSRSIALESINRVSTEPVSC